MKEKNKEKIKIRKKISGKSGYYKKILLKAFQVKNNKSKNRMWE